MPRLTTHRGPSSAAGSHNAASPTPLLGITWLQCCMTPGYYIHDQAMAKGWVEAAPPSPHHAGAAPASTHYVFKLASGHTTTEPWLRKYLGDANVQACLNMRNTPRCAITTAADYGKLNLDIPTKHYPRIASQDDSGKAKFMYLAHHEGPGGALLVIGDKLDETHVSEKQRKAHITAADVVKAKLITQVGTAQATARLKKLPDPFNAYRFWVTNYVENKIKLINFSCPHIAKKETLKMDGDNTSNSIMLAASGSAVINPPKTQTTTN